MTDDSTNTAWRDPEPGRQEEGADWVGWRQGAWFTVRRSLDDLRTAAAFLTVLPDRRAEPDAGAARGAASTGGFLDRAMAMFPVVGAGVGAAAGAAFVLADGIGLPPLVAAPIGLAVLVAATGALHEDGLGDVADGFGGGRTREDKLRIMRDSRVGTYGVTAIAFSLALRAAALAVLPVVPAVAALIAAAALSRAMLPAVLYGLPAARPSGLGAAAGRPQMRTAVLALAIGGLIGLVAVGPAAAVLATAMAAVAAAAVVLLAHRQIGGQTGDVCGAAQQAAEVAALLAVVAWQ